MGHTTLQLELAPEIGAETQRQKTALLSRNAGIALAVNLVNASLVAYVNATLHLPFSTAFAWCAVVVAGSLGRYLLARRFPAVGADPAAVTAWRRRYVRATAVVAAAWGSGGVLFMWDAPDAARLFNALVLCGMVGGAVPILAPVPAAFRIYALLLGVPMSAVVLFQAQAPLHWAFGAMAVVFLLAVLGSAQYLHHTLDASIRLALEKGRLVQNLQLRTDELRRNNATLEQRVTERTAALQRSEEALREKGRRLRTLFDDSPVAIWEEDFSALKPRLEALHAATGDGLRSHLAANPETVAELAGLVRVVDINQESARMLGVASKEQVWKHLPDYFEPRSLPVFADEMAALAGGATRFDCEIPIRTPGGEEKFLALRLNIAPGHEADWSRVFVTFSDISARRRTEQALRESQARLGSIIASAMDAVISIDAEQRIILFNEAAEKMFRCPAAETLGTSLERFIPGHLRARHARHVQAFAESGAVQGMMGRTAALVGLRADGAEFPVEASISRAEIGGQAIFTVILRDISERKREEEARRTRALARRLVEVQEAERRRLAEALHDVASPNLAAIGLNLARIARNTSSTTPAQLQERLADTQALLADTAAGIRAVCFDLRPAALDYWGLVPAVESYAEQFSHRTGIEVRVRAQGFDRRLSAEQEAILFRIVQEALTNCAKHAEAHAIDIALEVVEERLRMSICDDGVGFDPENPGATGRGPGLGLLTMRERAEFAGGTLQVEAKPGQGTRVVLEV